MLNKLSTDIDFTDDYHMLSLVSQHKDYSLCFHINKVLNFEFEKYDDFFNEVGDPDVNPGYSWYYYYDEVCRTTYYLIGNKSNGHRLVVAQKQVDYFLLIKDAVCEESVRELSTLLRKTNGVNAVIKTDMSKIRNINILFQLVELHELESVKTKK